MTVDESPKIFDEVDYQIILALSKDARMSSSKVAKLLGINERTARRRMDNLLETGAVRVSAICEPSAFGYNSIIDVHLNVKDGDFEKTAAILTEHVAVCYLSHGWGGSNMIVQARFKSSEEINQFLYGFIKQLQGVELESYYFESKIIEDIDTWLPEEKDFVKSSRINTGREE